MATKPFLLLLLVDQLCLAQRAPRYLSVFTIVRFNADACLGFYTNRCTFLINLFGTEECQSFYHKKRSLFVKCIGDSGGESVRLTQTVTWTEDTGTVRSRCLVPSTFDLILMVA